MSNPELTIIIPCYNCTKTLTEAVDSCYIQNLDSFEIVMVDDGSTDGTYALMEELKNKHENIRIFKNEKNLGGGATRNRAVTEAQADIIFCLDSDDMLPEGSLSRMLSYIKEKGCDAVGIHKSIKFRGDNIRDIVHTGIFERAGEIIQIDDLLEKNGYCSLYSTFMIRKSSFTQIGGYTTLHGFDTQSLAWRFLKSNLIAYTCPDASYYHRVQFHTSYYDREYISGKINFNWLNILIENAVLFDDATILDILSFDIHSEKNIMLYVRNHVTHLSTSGSNLSQNIMQLYTNYSNSKYSEALETYKLLPDTVNKKDFILYIVYMCKLHTGTPSSADEKKAFKIITSFKNRNSLFSLTKRVLSKLITYVKKNN